MWPCQVLVVAHGVFSCSMWDLGLGQGSNLGSLQWEHGVSASGPPGKSLHMNFRVSLSILLKKKKKSNWNSRKKFCWIRRSMSGLIIVIIVSLPFYEHGLFFIYLGLLWCLSTMFCSFWSTRLVFLLFLCSFFFFFFLV